MADIFNLCSCGKILSPIASIHAYPSMRQALCVKANIAQKGRIGSTVILGVALLATWLLGRSVFGGEAQSELPRNAAGKTQLRQELEKFID